jgi:transposase InsO family protein
MCSHRSWFTQFSPLSKHTKVILSDDSAISTTGTGRIKVWMFANGKWVKSVLQDDLYVLDLHGNLLSVSHLAWHGAEVCFLGENCHVYDKCKSLVLEGRLRNNLYVMQMQIDSPVIAKLAILDTHLKDTSQPPSYALTSRLTSSSALLDLWHRRLGHLHTRTITRMMDDNLVTGMDISNCDPPASLCKPCLEGKQTWDTISKVTSMCAKHVLSRMFTDMCRPLPTTFHRGFRYFITFVDSSSCYTSISPLREKSEVSKLLKVFIARAELETGQHIKILCSDRGGEYMAGHIQQYLQERGIKHKVTTTNTPQYNGVAERLNQTLLNKVQTMLADANLPKSYWLEALNYTTLLYNVSPSRSIPFTPSKAYTGTKPDVSRLQTFSCVAHVHIPKQSRDKLSAHSMPCTFLRFSQ